MDTNTPSQKHWSWTFTPAVILTIIFVFALIAAFASKGADEGNGDETLYALFLCMPVVIVALLVDVFLRILFRNNIKYKILYLWAIELVAIALIIVIGLAA